MGWMSWEIFRCQTNCATHPDSCINAQLYSQMVDKVAADGYLQAGYKTVSIDDCWEAPLQRGPKGDPTKPLSGDPKRFPLGMKHLGDYMHSKGVSFGIYSDEGTQTCGGFPGSEGYERLDADTFASWGVDYLKLDGCYNNKSGFVKGYPAMGAALQSSGRDIVYSCSWPAYLGGNESAKPWAAMIASGCNSWRNWEDIDCGWQSLVQIIEHWGMYGKMLSTWSGPGHWHDPDMLLIGNGCLTHAEEQTQMALWAISAAPLIMGNDLRNISAESKAILLNKGAIEVDQDPAGKMGFRVNTTALTQIWARPLANGDVAVALYNKGGGSPSGIVVVEEGAYCAGVNSDFGFGHTLESCRDDVKKNATAEGWKGYFYYSEGYNGQCTAAKDDCSKRTHNGVYSIYQLQAGAPAVGLDITLDFTQVLPFPSAGGIAAAATVASATAGSGSGSGSGGAAAGGAGGAVEVYDIWAEKALGSFTGGSFTAKNIAHHGTAFLRLTPSK